MSQTRLPWASALPPRQRSNPGGAMLRLAAGRSWSALALLSLAAAVLWRATGLVPPAFTALDMAGLGLALAALWLAPALEQQLAQQQRFTQHVAPGARPLQQLVQLSAGFCLLLSTAPAALLLAYSGREQTIGVSTGDGLEFMLPLWAPLSLGLLLLGAGLALAALGALLLARRACGTGGGIVVWAGLLCACYEFGASSGWLSGILLARGGWAGLLAATNPGGYAKWLLMLLDGLEQDPSRSTFLHELLAQAIVPAAIVWLGGLLLILAGLRWARQPAVYAVPGWAVPAAAVLCAAVRAAADVLAWMNDMTLRFPGDWRAVLGLGFSVLLLGAWLMAWEEQPLPSGKALLARLGWMYYALAACACLTLPGRLADQVYRSEVLFAVLGLAVLLAPAVLLLHRIGQLQRATCGWWRDVALLLLLLLVVLPLGQLPLPVAAVLPLGARVIVPDQAERAITVLGGLLLCALLLWPWPRRRAKAR